MRYPARRIRSTGEILYPKGAFRDSPPGLVDVLGFMRAQILEISDAEEALAASKRLLDAETDGIKLYAATWFPPFADFSRARSRRRQRRPIGERNLCLRTRPSAKRCSHRFEAERT